MTTGEEIHLEELEGKLADKTDRIEELEIELADSRTEVAELTEKIEELSNDLLDSETGRDCYDDRIRELAREVRRLEDLVEFVQVDNDRRGKFDGKTDLERLLDTNRAKGKTINEQARTIERLGEALLRANERLAVFELERSDDLQGDALSRLIEATDPVFVTIGRSVDRPDFDVHEVRAGNPPRTLGLVVCRRGSRPTWEDLHDLAKGMREIDEEASHVDEDGRSPSPPTERTPEGESVSRGASRGRPLREVFADEDDPVEAFVKGRVRKGER